MLFMFHINVINELVNQKRGVTPSTALRLAKFFDVSPDFWLNLQMRRELYKAQNTEQKEIESILSFKYLQKIA